MTHKFLGTSLETEPKMYSTTAFALVVLLATTCHGVAINKVDEAPITNSNSLSANNGFTVQSGYEGYFLNNQKPSITGSWLSIPKFKIIKSIILPISTFLVIYGTKALGIVFHLLLAVLLGVATTTAVCSFTPLCTISLTEPGLFIFKGKSVKEQVAELTRNYMTPENLEMLSRFVQGAFDKYYITQRREVEQPEPKVSENETTSK